MKEKIKEKKKILIISVLALMFAAMAAVGLYYWYQNAYYVATEDARITADLVKISPQISGKLLEFTVSEGDQVSQDQVLGRQEMVSLPDTSLDLSVIKAPISGTIIRKAANLGEVVGPGQPLAMVADLNKVYVSVNIEETKLGRVRPGQNVEIRVDSCPGWVFNGTVESIGQAASSTFSLIPTSTGGNFTKVIQRIPVKIKLVNDRGKTLLPGVNAEVKIQVK